MKKMLGAGLVLFAVVSLAAFGGKRENILVRFNGAIGAVPVSNVTVNATTGAVTVSPNTVRGVVPPGQIWRISTLNVNVFTDGHIVVHGRGLLLGGGNNIGTNAGQSVFATLFCASGSSSTNATGVALDEDGNFTIDDTLSPSPTASCDAPVLLIRTTGGTHPWFAAGIED